MKTLQECLDLVRLLESRNPINDWSLDGIRIWPLVRTLLFYRLTLSLRGSEPPPPGSGVLAVAERLLESIAAPMREPSMNLPRSAPAEVFVLTYAGIRQTRIDGRFVDIRTGPLIEALASRGIGCHVWEYAVPPPHRFPRKNPTYLVQRSFDATQVQHRLFGRTLASTNLAGYGDFCTSLRDLGLLYPELLERNLLREFGLVLSLRDGFDQAFEVIRPALAFSSNVGRYEFALNLACHGRNIPAVELQHGVQGPSHGQYAAWTQVPTEGYELLPQAYWCWDEASASTINEWSRRCAPRHQAVAGGIPWLEYCAGIPATPVKAAKGRRIGLVTLQPPGKIYADDRLLPEFVLEGLSKAGPGWIWWVRPHPAAPCDTSPLAKELRRRGIDAEIEAVRTAPLPHLLARADLHLTHSSSSVLEAGQLGVGSIVWSEHGAGLYADAIRAGRCRVALDADGLVAEMNREPGLRRSEAAPPASTEKILTRFLELGRGMASQRSART